MPVEIQEKSCEELVEVSLNRIRVNPYQPRRSFVQEELEELAQSIRSVGLIHPPVVRPVPDSDLFEIISGERRCRAAQLAGLKKLMVLVRPFSQSHSAEAALIENIQRVDLNPLEIAKAMRELIGQFGFQQDELAVRLGKKRSTVANYLRLLSLPKDIQDSVSNGSISMGHAKAILSLEGFEKQNLLHEIVLRDQLTVRETEEAALRLAEKTKRPPVVDKNRDFFIEHLCEKMQRRLGTKVSIQALHGSKRGKIVIDYYNLDDLDRLLALFGIEL